MADLILEYWPLSILATIILGAIGSGLWDMALKPIARKVGSILFTVLTFGAKRARDGIYRRAAMGHHELSALYVLFFIIGTVIAFSMVASMSVVAVGIAQEEMFKECNSEANSDKRRSCKRVKIREILDKHVPYKYVPYMVLYLIFTSIFFSYKYLEINRINLVVTYFQQCLRSLGPVMTRDDRLRLEQSFALIENKESFEALIKEINEIAEATGARLPKSYI